MGLFLAIDYGQMRIGTALSDETHTISQTYKTILNDKEVFYNFAELIRNKDIEKFIIGLPLGLAQKPTAMSLEVEKFAEELSTRTGIPYDTWNETFTSEIAKRYVKRKNVDNESARIILQEYLDYKKYKL